MTGFVDIARSSLRSLAKKHPGAKGLLQSANIQLGLAQHTVAQLLRRRSGRAPVR